ncbi:phage terminase large subunit [Hathewaya proteolytica DSM 3090]|uniref:Phage terminase large subunit n=1 Tax=Hathewaya proteolytica DSM 3090 TaxID=1121331 RepID=A0A1M6L1H2_9CLOT|nr:phage terminase large subunit [Hathewaya proteolytica DSM 3090]
MPQLQNYNTRFNIYYGGAGSGKSKFVVQKLILKYLRFANRKCLVVRKVSNTLRDSIFQEFKTILGDWKIYSRCEVKETLLTIILPNGSQFIFKGLDDPEKIKSISGIDDIIIEECTEIDLTDFNQLNLRLRSKNKYNQIHCMFNPISKSNWVYKKWFENEYNEENTMILKTTYKDNKFLPQDYIKSLEEMKDTDPAYYRIYALGEFASLDKLVYTNWEVQHFNWEELIKQDDNIALFGLDFGYVNDPSAFIAIVVNKSKKLIYVFDEMYKKGLLNNEIAKELISKGYSKEVITCDSAEQKSIEELRQHGLRRAKGARKGRDSIINGIQLIHQYKLIIHPNCINIQEELKNYTWQKDKLTKEYINKPIDNFNHLLDALRYATEDLQKAKHKISTMKIAGI